MHPCLIKFSVVSTDTSSHHNPHIIHTETAYNVHAETAYMPRLHTCQDRIHVETANI